MNWVLILLCWIVGAVGQDEGCVERVRARGRCRAVRVRRHEVVVRFDCQEDAEMFAGDLAEFLRD